MLEPPEEEKPGIPAWVVTFADLMSLLMCFFVLLLSFSEIDAMKFKQIAGELSKAFGVQRDVAALEIPMGTSPIFDKFSPGKPEPTPIDSVRQQTTEEAPQLETLRGQSESDIERVVDKVTREQIDVSLQALEAVLDRELQEGRLQLEHDRKRIIIRVEEKGSFPSGSADMTPVFADMLDKIAVVLAQLPGEITIEGHTDDIPINTPRFRSNWDLSAARASSVANALLLGQIVEPGRMRVQGYAETRPRASNDTPETRALNRRVEIIVDLSGPAEEYEKRLRALMEEDLEEFIHELELRDVGGASPAVMDAEQRG
ncbi:flagellar motor protein MotB [Pseudomonas sp.]|uniref:flagellar motor protein MotB n=1 Tax=Pseudomonas sp. TaxID=306 RepID=UPI00272A46F2|nr:flagellar motor protein MotB [Pseudomonas sp.]